MVRIEHWVEDTSGPAIHTEAPFERHISDMLKELDGEGWQVSYDDEGFDAQTALVMDDFIAFLEAVAPEKLEKMREVKGGRWRSALEAALVKSLEKNGTVQTLRRGFPMAGFATIPCMAGYPDDSRVPGAIADYEANICRFMHQVHYQTAGNNSLDFACFVNGIPVATGEVKTELTQTYADAIDEYAERRRPVEADGRKNPLLAYKRGAVVHLAVSEDEVWMCTNLGPFKSKGAKPRFLPFNLGDNGHAGNPQPKDGDYKTHYLWDYIMRRDNWLSIFDRFVFEEVEKRQDATGRSREVRTQIFPRFHQFSCERRILADVRANGAGTRYLVEHSAGSGKTETISWCAHDLARVRREDGEKLFSSVIVVTDRLALDANIKKTISQLSSVKGQVVMIGRGGDDGRSKSAQLVDALEQHREIVVVTIQTFLFAYPDIATLDTLSGRSFAVIVDEAHSSQEGSSAASLKTALNAAADKMKSKIALDASSADDDMTDEEVVNAFFAQVQAGNAMPGNVTFLAFTATPKAETKTLFGTPTGEVDAKGNPVMGSFDLYPMRQAVEEGYIIDPLTGYVPLKTVATVEDGRDSDELVDERAAKRRIAKWRSLHPTNVMEKAKWIVDHFVDNVAGLLNGEAKAMIVTSGRPEVVRYKYAIDAYLKSRPDLDPDKVAPNLQFKVPGEPLVAFSEKVSGFKCVMDEDDYLADNPFAAIRRDYDYTEANMNPRGCGSVEQQFDQPKSRLLIVANKFQTGFDQKKLVALYVDKKLGNAIEVVQTYSRVNRTFPGKDEVFVIDFANRAEDVLAAFKLYDAGAAMNTAQDPDAVYDVKETLDNADVYDAADIEAFKAVLFKARAAADVGDAARKALYAAVSAPAQRFNDALRSAQDSYETWQEMLRDAEAAGDDEGAEYAQGQFAEAKGRVAELRTFAKGLAKFCSLYAFLTQLFEFDDPDLEVFHSFAKLMLHKMRGTVADDVDMRGLVMSNYRIVAQKTPDDAAAGELSPTGGQVGGAAPKRDTMAKIVERLNRTWGSDGDPLVKARAVNNIADIASTDAETAAQVKNGTNSREAVFAGGRFRNVVIRALMMLSSGDGIAELADQALSDDQAIEPIMEQVFDLIQQDRRYDLAELSEYLRGE